MARAGLVLLRCFACALHVSAPCVPSEGFGYSGPEGAVSGDQCVPSNACPAGTDYKQGNPDMAFSAADCVCKVRELGGRCTACCVYHWRACLCVLCKWSAERQCLSQLPLTNASCVGACRSVHCVQPGFGSASGSGVCRRCSPGTYSEGGSMEDCKVGGNCLGALTLLQLCWVSGP